MELVFVRHEARAPLFTCTDSKETKKVARLKPLTGGEVSQWGQAAVGTYPGRKLAAPTFFRANT